MKAAVLYEPNTDLVIEEISARKPGPHEVLVRTSFAGLCHSDLHFMEGLYPHPLPAVLGHESSGVVEQVGSEVTYLEPGDHVISCLSVFCGTCEMCNAGRPVLCKDTSVKMLPGQAERLEWQKPERLHSFLNLSSYAEQMLVHENAIVKIRKDMPLDKAALIGCGVITGTGAVFNRAQVKLGDSCVVIGSGGVGLNVIQAGALRAKPIFLTAVSAIIGGLFIVEHGPTPFKPATGRNDRCDQHNKCDIGQDGRHSVAHRLDCHEDLQGGVNQQRISDVIAHRFAPVARANRRLSLMLVRNSIHASAPQSDLFA